jgi:hypothetical protein
MSQSIKERLEGIANTLPTPTLAAQERARTAALAALGEPPEKSQIRRTRFWPSRRRGVLLLAAALAGATAVALVLVSPWQNNALASQRALAALGDGPVIHAVVQSPGSRSSIIDLATGDSRPQFLRNEYWYDGERDMLRAQLSVDGRPLPGAEYVQTTDGFFTDLGNQGPGVPPSLDPALTGFASQYRDALASGQAHVVGEDTVDGRKAILLQFELPEFPPGTPGAGQPRFEDVAVDARDFRPLRFRISAPGRQTGDNWWRVVAIETMSREPGLFAPPPSAEPRPSQQTGTTERTLTASEAAAALPQPAVWPGTKVEGIDLTKIDLLKLTTRWTDGKETESHALQLQYGASRRTSYLSGEPSLIITEGTAPYDVLRFAMLGGSVPDGTIQLSGLGGNDGSPVDQWIGSMKRDGLYITLESARRDLVLSAARSMNRM